MNSVGVRSSFSRKKMETPEIVPTINSLFWEYRHKSDALRR
jgi:hypothetical protein